MSDASPWPAKVDNAKVVKTDMVCSSGVIHVIDAVVLAKATSSKEPLPQGRSGAVPSLDWGRPRRP